MSPVVRTANQLLYDAVDISALPPTALCVAGYVDGQWPTHSELVRRYPRARVLSIATSPGSIAEFLDIEKGDAVPADAPAWLDRAHRAGIARPGLYASLSAWSSILAYCRQGGWPRPRLKVWTAHWNGVQHCCSPACGFGFGTRAGATQYLGPAPDRPYDTSLATSKFLEPPRGS